MKSDDKQKRYQGLKNVCEKNNNKQELPSESAQGLPLETDDLKYCFNTINFSTYTFVIVSDRTARRI